MFFGEQEQDTIWRHCSGAYSGWITQGAEYCFDLRGLHTTYSHQHTPLQGLITAHISSDLGSNQNTPILNEFRVETDEHLKNTFFLQEYV